MGTFGGADFDWGNLQAACTSHHSQKSIVRDGGFGRAPNPKYVPEVCGCDAAGLPTSPIHPWKHKKPANHETGDLG
jgi:hypothetical protein